MQAQSRTSASDIQSFHLKLLAYAEYLGSIRPTWDQPKYLAEEAHSLLASADAKTLRAVAKEVDVWVRETLDPHEQDDAVAHMTSRGVDPRHLPKTATTKRLQAILRRGSIRNHAELSMVRSALDLQAPGRIADSEWKQLGMLFDQFTSGLKSCEGASPSPD